MSQVETITLADVPAVLRVPGADDAPATGPVPVVVLWHGFGLPNSERAMAEALPLDDVPAVKVYLGLPLFGQRLPPGGVEEIVRRQADDYILDLFVPAVGGAVAELPAVLGALREHLPRHAPRVPLVLAEGVALVGFSASGLAPLLALAERAGGVTAGLRVDAAVAINTVPRLAELVALLERLGGRAYAWSDDARAAAARFDMLARAQAVAAPVTPSGGPPALLLLHGAADEYFGAAGIGALHDALAPAYAEAGAADRLAFEEIAGLTHHFGSPNPAVPVPVSDPALVRPRVSAWLRRWCRSG